MSALGKADTAYLNPDGVEVEVDLQGIVEAPLSRLDDGPAEVGEYALTYLRKRGPVYIKSLAEDAAVEGPARRTEGRLLAARPGKSKGESHPWRRHPTSPTKETGQARAAPGPLRKVRVAWLLVERREEPAIAAV
jgi:hypothetical protein